MGETAARDYPEELPVGYYLKNFQTILDFVDSHYDDIHAENVLWVGLFGLAFWDIVFLSLPGTFFNRYQRGPRDLFRPEFSRRRGKLIEERLNHIETSRSWPDELLDLYDHKLGTANDLVHWKFLPRELVEQSVKVIPRRHLVVIFDKLSQNPGANKSGFPDLILFSAARRRTAKSYELVEVKGPGDQLQINQTRWLKYFAKNGIPYRIIRVQWREQVIAAQALSTSSVLVSNNLREFQRVPGLKVENRAE